jgi:hypothetical protein
MRVLEMRTRGPGQVLANTRTSKSVRHALVGLLYAVPSTPIENAKEFGFVLRNTRNLTSLFIIRSMVAFTYCCLAKQCVSHFWPLRRTMAFSRRE